MIGFYNYTVILTYISLLCGVGGIYASMTGNPVLAVFLLMACGVCDMFDGKIARTRKKSTESEKRFGIQIDSLADIICFCALPAAIVVAVRSVWYSYLVGAMIILCGVIRLAYFNVCEEERQQAEKGKNRTYYEGLPVTSSAIVIPMAFCFEPFFGSGISAIGFSILVSAFIALEAILYILPIKVAKPKMAGAFLLIIFGLFIVTLLSLIYIAKIL